MAGSSRLIEMTLLRPTKLPGQNVKFCLMIVTHEKWYAAVPDAPPSCSTKYFFDLENAIQNIKPGYGRNYLMHICRCDEDGNPEEKEIVTLTKYRDNLIKRLSR